MSCCGPSQAQTHTHTRRLIALSVTIMVADINLCDFIEKTNKVNIKTELHDLKWDKMV